VIGKSVCCMVGDETEFSVVGVNLVEPDSAPRVIKTWDDRLTEGGVDSGVDDEVRSTFFRLCYPTCLSYFVNEA
jgi:hypothetical protein